MNQLWTIPSAAKKLGINEKTIRRQIKSGELKLSRIGNAWVIGPEDLKRIKIRPAHGPKKTVRVSGQS